MTADVSVLPGDLVAGRLRIVREIARGGMGVLFEAEDTSLGRRVAVKVMLGDVAHEASMRERLLREARAAAKLSSPHITQVLEVGTLPEGAPFVVLELLEGETVDDVLVRQGLLPLDTALAWFLEALDAVVEAHDAGLVHRDLKPGNLFVARTSAGTTIKVLDFGLVRDVSDAGAPNLTQTGESLGTPAYMAPEQIASARAADRRSDVWALGATLYEMLTGRLPFEATSLPALFRQITTGDPTPIGTWRTDIGDELAGVVQRCLARSPDARFPDARALRDALFQVQRRSSARHPVASAPNPYGGTVRMDGRPRDPSAVGDQETLLEPQTGRTAVEPRRPRRPTREPPPRDLRLVFVAGCLGVLLAGAIGVIVTTRSAQRDARLATTAPRPSASAFVATPEPEPVDAGPTEGQAAVTPPAKSAGVRAVTRPAPPPRRCRCVDRVVRSATLCREFGPPYACLGDKKNELCKHVMTEGVCNDARWPSGSSNALCRGYAPGYPGFVFDGTLEARGACIDADYPPAQQGIGCNGLRSATDQALAFGTIDCDPH